MSDDVVIGIDDLQKEIDDNESKIQEIIQDEDLSDLIIEVYTTTSLTSGSVENKNRLAETFNDSGNYQLTNQGGNIVFASPYYVTTIGFEPEKVGFFELSYTNVFNQTYTKRTDTLNKDNRIVFTVNEAIKNFSLKYEKKPLSLSKKTTIKNFRIFGLTQKDYFSEINYIKGIKNDREEYEKKINQQKQSLLTLLERIKISKLEFDTHLENLNERKELLEENIQELTENKNSLQADINQQNRDIESNNSKILAQSNEISNLDIKIKELERSFKEKTDAVNDLEGKRKNLEKKVNLFPDTLDGFIQRANKTKITYGILAIIPLIIFALLLNLSWETLKNFTTTISLNSFESAWIVLIQRIPFTLLVITLASMCIAFLYKMVRHLTEVQQQELNLAKISMLAKDVADSVYSNLPEPALQKIRAEKKLILIREFMNSEYIRYQQFTEKEKHHSSKSVNFIPFTSNLKNYIPFLKNTDSNTTDK